MGIDRSFSRFPVLAFPAACWTLEHLWAAQSSYTEQSPVAPVPVPDRDTDMVLDGAGTIWASVALDLLAMRAGFPGPDGGAFVWKKDADPVTDYRGWDAPNVMVHWEALQWSTGGAGKLHYDPHAVALSDGTIVYAFERHHTVAPVYRISVAYRSPSLGTWTTVDVHVQTTAPAHNWQPALLVLPNDRLLLAHWVTSGSEAQVKVWYSDDGGATWAVWQPYALKTPITIDYTGPGLRELSRLRWVHSDGQILLVAGLYDDNGAPANNWRIKQWCSTDLAASFFDVYEGDGSGQEALPDVVVYDGKFQVYYLSSTDNVVMRELAEASIPLDQVEPVNIPFNAIVVFDVAGNGDLAACVDPDGSIYVTVREVVQGYCPIQRSSDGGATWGICGTSARNYGVWWDANDAGTYPTSLCLVAQGSRLLALHNWVTAPGANDASICGAYLGGWSTVTMPATELFPDAKDRTGWTDTYVPIELPENVGWTAAGIGTGTLADGYIEIVTALLAARTYEKNPTGTIDEGFGSRIRLKVSAGGALGTREVSYRVRLADGTDDYDVSLRFTSTQFRVYDENAGAAVGADKAFGVAATEVEVLFWMGRGKVRTWYRARPDNMPDREWTEGPYSAALTNDNVTPDANNSVRWGNPNVAGTNPTSRWYEVHWVSDEYTGIGLQDGQTNPGDLFPRPFSSGRVYLYGGAEITAVDGPCHTGDSWSLPTRAEYPAARIFPAEASSPTDGWRSTAGDTAQHRFAVAHDTTLLGTAESHDENDLIALVVTGANWRTGLLRGYDVGTGAWVTVATIDLASGLALPYTRQGSTLIPNGTGNYPYLFHSECKGWTVSLDAATFRKVAWQSEGVWGNGSTYKQARIGFAATGAEPANGTLRLWSPNAMILVCLNGATYAGWQLVIDSQSTYESDHRIGTAFLASCAVPGRRVARGWVIETQPNVEIRTARDGTRTSRRLGANRRVVELPWTDLLPAESLFALPASPGYQLASTIGNIPVGTANDVHGLLEGVLERTEGGNLPLGFCWATQKAGVAGLHVQHFLRRHEWLYARLSGSLRYEAEQGVRGYDDAGRTPGVVLEEEL